MKIILYPILGEKSMNLAKETICKAWSLEQYMAGQPPEKLPISCETADVRFRNTMNFLSAADVAFVPLVISGDGSWIVRGNDIDQIRQHLGLALQPAGVSSDSGCGPGQTDGSP